MRLLPPLAMPLGLVLTLALTLASCASRDTTPGGVPETSRSVTPSASVPSTPAPSASQPTSFAPSAAWPRLKLEEAWSGLDQPLYLTSREADPAAFYIVEKGGVVREARDSAVRSFLDLSGKVSRGGEQGLLSIAFPPGRASAERMYAYYTDKSGDVVVSRFALKDGVADPGSEHEVLRVGHRKFSNHNGGQLEFGPDGMLYVGIGDGGSGGDPDGNGQNLGVLLAKLLRLDVEGVSAGGKVPRQYLVPPDNPFAKRAGARPEIWAYGLRNPWRFSFDAFTRDLYIADVGQNAWEEIDFQPASSRGGEDYGWNVMEGLHPYEGGSEKGLTPPVAEYGHDLGQSVTGGYVYRGSRYPSLRGVYLFADFGSGRVWGMRREDGTWNVRELAHTAYGISSFGEDAHGELYLLDLGGGAVYHVTAR